jgi:hypothetical protein
MIRETTNRKNLPAVTSNQWHVVHARRRCETDKATSTGARFVRLIVSEHQDRAAAVAAARQVIQALEPEMSSLPSEVRDQVFVRRPEFKSLKAAKRVRRARS